MVGHFVIIFREHAPKWLSSEAFLAQNAPNVVWRPGSPGPAGTLQTPSRGCGKGGNKEERIRRSGGTEEREERKGRDGREREAA